MFRQTRHCLPPKRSLFIAFAALLMVLVLFFISPDVIELMEMGLMDWRTRLRGPKDPGSLVKIITIDTRSLRVYGLNQKMRYALADVIKELCDEGATAIGLDIYFVPTGEDSFDLSQLRLTEAIQQCGKVALGYNWSKEIVMGRLAEAETIGRRRLLDATRNPEEEGFTPEQIPNDVASSDPRLMQSAAAVGYFTVISDPMNIARKIPATLIREGHHYFPFSLAIVRVALGASDYQLDFGEDENTLSGPSINDLKLYPDPGGYLWFNHYGTGRAFETLNFDDVVIGGIPDDFAPGSIVLIGVSGPESNDLFMTPYDLETPGVVLHATAVANALVHGFLWRDTTIRGLEVAIMAFIALIMGIFLPRLSPLQANCLGPILAVAVWATGHALLNAWSIWLHLIPPLLLICLAHVAILSARLYYAERCCMVSGQEEDVDSGDNATEK